jgi:hypothetical protein
MNGLYQLYIRYLDKPLINHSKPSTGAPNINEFIPLAVSTRVTTNEMEIARDTTNHDVQSGSYTSGTLEYSEFF